MALDKRILAAAILLFTTYSQGVFGILDRSYSINATVGQQVSLPCMRERDYSIAQIEWRKQDGYEEHKIVIYNPRFGQPTYYRNYSRMSPVYSGENLMGSTLEIQEVGLWHSGTYVCELTTYPAGTVKVEVHLLISARMSKPTVTYTCSEGAVTLTCNSEESGIKWSRNGITMQGEFRNTFMMPEIPHPRDVYSCTARNSVSEEKSENMTILCPVQLSIRMMPRNQNVTEGGTLSIICHSNPPADQYIFWIPRKKYSPSVAVDSNLTLENVTKNDEGLYTCQPQWTPARPGDGTNITTTVHVFPKNGIHSANGGATSLVTCGTEQRLFLAVYSVFIFLFALIS